ncbi:hypothetical protein BB559_004068 [Furculomyces boomerangus]|uniref:Uncharacterized protein n=2 Tax=Harpellales TaxID=61421 RepID=A0A2T9YGW0_9FUNG|nr:hypothetical protein BB559_004068 [Furculomyces boomerangus]
MIGIRHRLTALRKNRDSYYKVEEVVRIYEDLVQQVHLLQKTRESEKNTDDNFSNRLDYVLDDCFQLISLFYMALGKNHEIPATYVQLVTIKQNLDLFSESAVYTQEDLYPFKERLEEISNIIKSNGYNQEEIYRPELDLVRRKLRQNLKSLEMLEDSIKVISDELNPIFTRLVTIRRQLMAITAACNGKAIENKEAAVEAKEYQRELLEIDEIRENNKFYDSDGTPAKGQAVVVGLLELCFDMVHDLLAEGEAVSDNMKPLYGRLLEIKQQLEKLFLTRRWALRETDLWSFQVQLQEIDGMRSNGQFLNEFGEPLPGQTQGVLNFLLHKCYSILYKLMSSSEPIAESLLPIHNQLRTLRRCLVEIKKYGGPLSAREIYPYQMKLFSIDSLRVDGKFLDDDGNIPEGQGIIMSLLSECYDLMHELISNEVEE